MTLHPGGPYSPVENRLPPAWRVGYEAYTADGHYGNLAMAFLAAAVLRGFRGEGPATVRPAGVHIEGDPTWRALCHRGPYSVQINAWPAEHYDGFGITDLTVGPGRYLQFVSSVRHLSRPDAFYNLGLALRAGGGPAEIRPLSQEPLAPTGPIERGPGEASLRLRARARGAVWTYALAVAIAVDGVAVEEATPGRRGPASLLVPYPRDCGTGDTTTVDVDPGNAGGAVVRLRLGDEVVRIDVEGAIERAIDLPYGYENRRGLCGLLRLDLAGDVEAVCYRVAVER